MSSTHKYTWELRREILEAVGVKTDDRFEDGSDRGIRKDNLIAVATRVQPDDEYRDYANARLTDIYSLLGRWTGVDHSPNSGRDWTMNRELIEAIHDELKNDDA